MQEVFIALQFSALIPVLIVVYFKPRLNAFFKLLLASIFLSIFFDITSTTFSLIFRNNLHVLCLYYISNAILITFLWQQVPFYAKKSRTLVKSIGFIFIGMMFLSLLVYKITIEAHYLVSCLSVFLGLVFALQYYYQKLREVVITPLIDDPYFITASAYVLFCLSTIIILAVHIQYDGQDNMKYIWLLRQFFYLIYSMIIGYAFYTLYKNQSLSK